MARTRASERVGRKGDDEGEPRADLMGMVKEEVVVVLLGVSTSLSLVVLSAVVEKRGGRRRVASEDMVVAFQCFQALEMWLVGRRCELDGIEQLERGFVVGRRKADGRCGVECDGLLSVDC